MTLAGTPALMDMGGRSDVTTAPAPTTAPFPIETPAVTTTLAPSQTSSPISMGASCPGWLRISPLRAVPWFEEKIDAQGPKSTLLPMVIGPPGEAHTEQRWLMKESSPISICSGYLKKTVGEIFTPFPRRFSLALRT